MTCWGSEVGWVRSNKSDSVAMTDDVANMIFPCAEGASVRDSSKAAESIYMPPRIIGLERASTPGVLHHSSLWRVSFGIGYVCNTRAAGRAAESEGQMERAPSSHRRCLWNACGDIMRTRGEKLDGKIRSCELREGGREEGVEGKSLLYF